MRRRAFLALVLGLLFVSSEFARAQQQALLPYSLLKLDLASRTNAISADQSNRVWVATNAGVAALLGTSLVPGFPLNSNDFKTLTGGDSNVIDVTFGDLSDGENFFLGFSNAVVFGRALSERSPSFNDTPLTLNAPLRSLASDRKKTLWAATNEGLLQWKLGGSVPDKSSQILQEGDAIHPVAVAPWVSAGSTPTADPAAVFFSETNQRLYVARAGDANARTLVDVNLSAVVGMDFEPDDPANPTDGNLWVAGSQGGSRVIVRYPGETLKGESPGDAAPESFSITALRSQSELRDLTVEKITGTIWIGTTEGAYFQRPQDGVLADADCTGQDASCIGWRLESSTAADRVDVAFADGSGNLWFGTDRGVRTFIVRLLTLSSSRYLGEVTASALLEDLPNFAANGKSGETAALDITVGGTKKTITATEVGDTGEFVFSFSFSVSAAPAESSVFSVASSTTGVPVEAKYTFRDSLGAERSLTAVSSWANIVPFEDGLIVDGPCFIEALKR